MKRILITAYDVDPYKGSESGLGWNLIYQASRFNRVLAITRENNKDSIESYIKQNNINNNLKFYYFDLPYFLRFWKVGARGSTLYFYLWQVFISVYILRHKLKFDIAHNLNFSTDSIPSFLWVLKKPFVWGPINHHEKIPYDYIKPYGFKAYIKDRASWMVKLFFWNIDPFNKLAKFKADVILGGNESVKKRLNIKENKFVMLASSGAPLVNYEKTTKNVNFNILVAGRFVPLKGIDVAINAFVHFVENNPEAKNVALTVIGGGPQEAILKRASNRLNDKSKIKFINWVELNKLIEYYQQSSVFLFPSHEGAGMVVVEALSYGLPVICFDNFGPGEMIDGKCGIKIPYSNYRKSIVDFSHAIKKLYKDNRLLKSLSTGARERYESNYTWDVKGERLKDVYDGICLK